MVWADEAADRAAFANLQREAAEQLEERRLAVAFNAWRLELYDEMLAATVSRIAEPHLTPRKPEGAPLTAWPVEVRRERPPWRGGVCRPANEPRKPPISQYTKRKKKPSGRENFQFSSSRRPRP